MLEIPLARCTTVGWREIGVQYVNPLLLAYVNFQDSNEYGNYYVVNFSVGTATYTNQKGLEILKKYFEEKKCNQLHLA